MQPAPSPSAGRGDVVLQPAFFTSVLYIQPLRDDISMLTNQFREQYLARDPAVSPFSVFKQLWRSEGWKWLHFRVFDDRAREMFLLVTARIFLEHLTEEDPIAQIVGFFGAYIFYYTQPEDTAPKLYRVNHIPIPIDYFKYITNLCESLLLPAFIPLREPVIYIASTMVKDEVFYILPSSDLGPENPRYLPREVLVCDSTSEPDLEAPKKKGRPSWRDKIRKAQTALEGLDSWLDSAYDDSVAGQCGSVIPPDDLSRYRANKTELIVALENSGDEEAVKQASAEILARLREGENTLGASSVERSQLVGVGRVERAMREHQKSGVLGLLEGAGCP